MTEPREWMPGQPLPLGVKRFLKVLVWVALPAFFLLSFMGPLAAQVWLSGCLAYGLFLLTRWAIRQDRVDKERGEIDQSLWDDLKEIEDMVTGAIKYPLTKKPKKLRKGLRRRNPEGDYMTCIFCDEYANSEGMYCDDHAD